MAKAGKKTDRGEHEASRTGGRRSPTEEQKAPRGSKRVTGRATDDEPITVEAVILGEVIEPSGSAPRAVTQSAADGGALAAALAATWELREQLQTARAEVADLLTALRSETRAAAAEVAELRQQCRQTGDFLAIEIDAEYGAAEQGRTAFREVLVEALAGVRRLREEIETVRAESAEARRAHPKGAKGDAEHEPEERKNRFGVKVAPGVVVAAVFADSPARAADLVRGDVIEEANGRPIHSGNELRDLAAAVPDGGELTLQIRRGAEPLIRTVRLGDGADGGKNRFGVTVASGVVIADVFAKSPAAVAGLERGDVIEDAHGQPVHSGDQLLSIIHAQPEGAEVMLVVTRHGERREILVHLDHT
jgi:hypothetical protein